MTVENHGGGDYSEADARHHPEASVIAECFEEEAGGDDDNASGKDEDRCPLFDTHAVNIP